ncbi:MAG: DUF29 family protein [Acidithiobacillus ferriphilus]|jgi:hypothetical protein|uniref:DUF29 domain-containing protein n=1 Tax=Acidithiobacillus ferriphilus TaxID=1689834 RepID=UPI002431C626|nr:DUF29 domain-containing protein [Acidithiobacillus ferriphilus]MBW9247736.1 DUF29 family protein [Acidithiobacillus ferriphilus]MBW9253783.1 DUF29 family protein [Acidithiobacillus ferriphilus]
MSTARQIEQQPPELYEQDYFAWTQQQASMLRSGQLSGMDALHLAEEIEDLGRSERRALASRMIVLLAHLLKWQHQPALRNKSWQLTIKTQRKDVTYELDGSPSLKNSLTDPEWLDIVWSKAALLASDEAGLDIEKFPEACPWDMTDVMRIGWLP